MQFNTSFIALYEQLSELNDSTDKNLTESAIPEVTSAQVDLSTCREVVSTYYNKIRNEFEASCVTIVNNRLSRVEVRTFVLRRNNAGEVFFLGRPCSGGKGYTTPGGGYDLLDGTPLRTAIRELWEELNISLINAQESSIHTFTYGNKPWPFVLNYVKNPEDQWTGYYQYYVTAEYGGEANNDEPEELGKYQWLPISVFEKPTDKAGSTMLQIIQNHKWSTNFNCDSDLEEAFDNEDIWGEAAKTVDGIVRYFVPDLQTLRTIIETGKIKQSQLTERDPNTKRGTKQSRKRPFVSFSHQLYSHAYRSARWRYGVALDIEKLRQSIPNPENNITDNFKHESRNIYVFGAAKLADGGDVIITSYGDFTINWDPNTRHLIKQHQGIELVENNFYEQVKDIFYNVLKKQCTDDIGAIKKAMRSLAKEKVIEGFVTTSTMFQSYGYQLVKLNELVPGLLEYVQNYTYLDEGELRIWLDFLNGDKFLDIGDCIVNVVIPSDYMDDPSNNLKDLQWLQDYITNNGLEPYIYDASRTPKRGVPGAIAYKHKKTSLADYFNQITKTRDALLYFIRTKLHPRAVKADTYDFWRFYTEAVAAETSAKKAEIAGNDKYNKNAFLAKAAELGFSSKTVKYLVKTGADL